MSWMPKITRSLNITVGQMLRVPEVVVAVCVVVDRVVEVRVIVVLVLVVDV